MAEDKEKTREVTTDEDIEGVTDEELGDELTAEVEEDYIPGEMNEIREGFNADKEIDGEDLAVEENEDIIAGTAEVRDEEVEANRATAEVDNDYINQTDDLTVGMRAIEDEEAGEDMAIDADDDYINADAARVGLEGKRENELTNDVTDEADVEENFTRTDIDEEHVPEDGDEIAEELAARGEDYFEREDQEAAEEIDIDERDVEREEDLEKKEIDNK